jgi:agmatinase
MNRVVSFGDIDRDESAYPTSRVVILPVPFEATTTYVHGTVHAPMAILVASTQMELYDEELNTETHRIGIHTLPSLSFDENSPEKALINIEESVGRLLDDGKFPVVLGGEHTITIGVVRALIKRIPSLHVLHLDAHADLRDHYQGSPFNHACTMRRVRELCPVVQVGIRSLSAEEADEARRRGWNLHFAHKMAMKEGWAEEAIKRLGNPLYITIDMDFFDSSQVPSVGNPEPGGFGWLETLRFLKEVIHQRDLVGFDIVELCPQGEHKASEFFAAKLIYRLIGYRFAREIRSAHRCP